jgi:phosphoglycolate phosphatase
MRFSSVVFDLDGTLLDTLADIAEAANSVLADHGFPTHPVDDYRHFVGEGVVLLFQRVFPTGAADAVGLERLAADFRAAYGRTWNRRTTLYPGVGELLDATAVAGLKLAILSNKPDDFTQLCFREYLSAWPFHAVLGQREGVPRKPDPTGALAIAAQLETPPERFLFLGDTATDMATALAAGMYPVGALWGFRPREELQQGGAKVVIGHPLELLSILDGNAF